MIKSNNCTILEHFLNCHFWTTFKTHDLFSYLTNRLKNFPPSGAGEVGRG